MVKFERLYLIYIYEKKGMVLLCIDRLEREERWKGSYYDNDEFFFSFSFVEAH